MRPKCMECRVSDEQVQVNIADIHKEGEYSHSILICDECIETYPNFIQVRDDGAAAYPEEDVCSDTL